MTTTEDFILDLVSSAVYPGLDRKPGVSNWVDRAGGLPSYIERIAKHLHYEKGMSISRAIATAVNTVKRWARMGKVAKYGDPNHKHVTVATAAAAAAAVAEWEAKKASGKIHLSDAMFLAIDLIEITDEYAIELAEELGEVLDLTDSGTTSDADVSDEQAGVEPTPHGTLRAGNIDLTQETMDLSALAERANGIADPKARATARQKVMDLAVAQSKLTVDKRKMYAKSGVAMADGSFPVFDRESLLSACRLARTPAQRAHITKRAKILGLVSAIPDQWGMSLTDNLLGDLLDLASTIAPRHARGRASDGRRSYKGQGKFKHGFIPINEAAKEAKAKGSPIAIKRLNRLFGANKVKDDPRTNARGPKTAPAKAKGKATSTPPKPVIRVSKAEKSSGRVGNRNATKKNNPKEVVVQEKSQGGAQHAQDVANIKGSSFDVNRPAPSKLPKSQLESSKSSRVPVRAKQNWADIPENLKTVRNGKRFVYAEFGGKGYVTPWIGGVAVQTSSPLLKRQAFRTLNPADAAQMSSGDLRAILNNKRSTPAVRKVANAAVRAKRKAPKNG